MKTGVPGATAWGFRDWGRGGAELRVGAELRGFEAEGEVEEEGKFLTESGVFFLGAGDFRGTAFAAAEVFRESGELEFSRSGEEPFASVEGEIGRFAAENS